jgi:hypothetical protein
MTEAGQDSSRKPVAQEAPKLIEAAKYDGAVAIFGTSVEVARRILTTGEVAPAIPDLSIEYQREIAEEGKYLYFGLPVMARLQVVVPDLVAEIKAGIKKAKSFRELFDVPVMEDLAAFYAHMNAVIEYYFTVTGEKITYKDYLERLPEVVPDQFDELDRDGEISIGTRGIFDGMNPSEREELVRLIKDPSDRALVEASSRKGVVLYLNEKILHGTEVIPGVEAIDEIVITSDKKLKSDIVSGIVPLADGERVELLSI